METGPLSELSPEEGRGREQQSLRCALLPSSASMAGTQPEAGGRGAQEPAPRGTEQGQEQGQDLGHKMTKLKGVPDIS